MRCSVWTLKFLSRSALLYLAVLTKFRSVPRVVLLSSVHISKGIELWVTFFLEYTEGSEYNSKCRLLCLAGRTNYQGSFSFLLLNPWSKYTFADFTNEDKMYVGTLNWTEKGCQVLKSQRWMSDTFLVWYGVWSMYFWNSLLNILHFKLRKWLSFLNASEY